MRRSHSLSALPDSRRWRRCFLSVRGFRRQKSSCAGLRSKDWALNIWGSIFSVFSLPIVQCVCLLVVSVADFLLAHLLSVPAPVWTNSFGVREGEAAWQRDLHRPFDTRSTRCQLHHFNVTRPFCPRGRVPVLPLGPDFALALPWLSAVWSTRRTSHFHGTMPLRGKSRKEKKEKGKKGRACNALVSTQLG